ncbi:MAG: TonB-dependent receptor [Acidobacteria bacterium]|nr:TonB-dependent receptor [Acidobacteriota bacterium]
MIDSRRVSLPALLLACALGPAARAAEAPDSEAPEDEAQRIEAPVERIEVRSDADEVASLDPTAFATVIRAADFAGRVTSLPELLRETVGVQVQNLGSGFSTVSIRGSTAEQVVVYLDGVPLNRALGGGVNLADLPLAQIESIEIYRGGAPAALMAASIGGAIVINTRRPEGDPLRSLSVSFGSFDTTEAVLSVSGARNRLQYFVGLDGRVSNGDFTFLDDNGTPQEGSDDGRTHRVNNDFTRIHFTGRAGTMIGERTRLTITGDLFRREQGVPGLSANQSETARLESTRLLGRAEVERPGLLGGRLLLSGALDYTRFDEAFDDQAGDIGLAPAQKTDNRIESSGAEFGAVVIASRHQALSFRASRRRETADLEDELLREPDLGKATRTTLAVTLEDQFDFAGGRLILNPSLRYERWDNGFEDGAGTGVIPMSLEERDSETTGRIGLRFGIREGLTLKANAGRFLRLPDFTELFGDRGSVLGNPALVPESGRTLDIGIEARRLRPGRIIRRARLEVSLFETAADNLILFIPNSQNTVVARNISRARVRGGEFNLTLALGSRFTGGINATLQRAVNKSGDTYDGNLLPGRPREEISTDAGLRLGRGRLSYRFTYIGENFVDRQNTESEALEERYLHDLGYRVDLPHGLQATVEIKNLTDDENVDVARFPLPGRSLHGRLTWRF